MSRLARYILTILTATLSMIAAVGLALGIAAAQGRGGTPPQGRGQPGAGVPGAPPGRGLQPAGAAQGQQQPPGTASLTGNVVVMGSSQPIPGASVEMRRQDCNNFSNPPEVVTTTADGNGKFTFQNLRTGGWCLVATAAGGAYTPAEYMQRGILGRGTTIPIADGQQVVGIQLAMAPTGGIAGRVRDADGEAFAHARVQVMEAFMEEGRRRLYILQVAQTNDLGEYRFFWLPPGPYYMAVVPENTRARSVVSVQPPPGTGGRREDVVVPLILPRIAPNGDRIEETYVPVYYPGETHQDRALPVDVRPGTTTGGIDITLAAARVRSFHVRGTARNVLTGEPAAGAQLRLAPKEWTATVVLPSAITDAKGNFDIAGVVSGDYILVTSMNVPNPAAPPPAPPPPGAAPARGANAAPQNRGNAQGPGARQGGGGAQPGSPPAQIQVTASMDISVSGSSVENLQLLLTPGVMIPARVVLQGVVVDAAQASGQRGLGVNLVREPDVVGLPAAQVRGSQQENGTIALSNVGPGAYRVYVTPLLAPFQWGAPSMPQPLQNLYVKSIRVGTSDVLTGRLQVNAGVSPGEIEVTVAAGGRFNGTTVNDKLEPVPNVSVALIPEGAYRERMDMYRTAISDLTGRVRMQGIPPGGYRVYAFEDAPPGAWQNPDFMRPHEGRGMPVDIRESSGNATAPANVQVPVIVGTSR